MVAAMVAAMVVMVVMVAALAVVVAAAMGSIEQHAHVTPPKGSCLLTRCQSGSPSAPSSPPSPTPCLGVTRSCVTLSSQQQQHPGVLPVHRLETGGAVAAVTERPPPPAPAPRCGRCTNPPARLLSVDEVGMILAVLPRGCAYAICMG
ncbi:unnamed protein product [Boreogadus saida]